jgi:hypothetical protein
MEDGLRWRNLYGVILRCVDKEEVDKLMTDLHVGHCGGHFAAHTTAHNILRVGYYWPTSFSDMHRYVISCQPCNCFIDKQCLPSLPLKPIIVEAPFQQSGLDLIGEFKYNYSNGYRWILTTNDYLIKWVEAIPTNKETKEVLIKFLEENIVTRLCVPAKITTNKGKIL